MLRCTFKKRILVEITEINEDNLLILMRQVAIFGAF